MFKSNPYIDRGTGPPLTWSAVAFLDVLGYADRLHDALQQGGGERMLANLVKALRPAHKDLRSSRRWEYGWPAKDSFLAYLTWLLKSVNPFAAAAFQTSTFTDNIVIGYPIRRGQKEWEALLELIYFVARYQFSLTRAGWFVRGGISIGDLYMDNVCVFGGALLDAYRIESSIARVPRVALAEPSWALLQKHQADLKEFRLSNGIEIDSDGTPFVDYLDLELGTLKSEMSGDAPIDRESYPRMTRAFLSQLDGELLQHRNAIVYAKTLSRNNSAAIEKYRWCAEYHNRFCGRRSRRFRGEFLVPNDGA